MTVDIYWRIGMEGDLASLRRPRHNRGDFDPIGPDSITPGLRGGESDGYRYIDHMAQVAKAAEISGFCGGLLPSFPMTDDPWVVSAALARETKAFRFMIAFQPGFLHPLQAARMSASLQRATNGRVVYNIITGGGGPAQLWWGDRVDHDDRYARTAEFLEVLKGGWTDQPFDYEGRFFAAKGASLPPPLARQPFPEIYFSGSSAAAIEAAGRQADYYLSWLEPFDSLETKYEDVRRHCEAIGRTPDSHCASTYSLERLKKKRGLSFGGDLKRSTSLLMPWPGWSPTRSGPSDPAASCPMRSATTGTSRCRPTCGQGLAT